MCTNSERRAENSVGGCVGIGIVPGTGGIGAGSGSSTDPERVGRRFTTGGWGCAADGKGGTDAGTSVGSSGTEESVVWIKSSRKGAQKYNAWSTELA
jgi:hypothetical protein